ncbi:hypothetical protein D3C87_1228140 [compost metagenome]
MVEENAVGGVNPVGFPVVDDDPVGVELGHRIGTTGVERCGFALRNLLNHAVELGGRRLVEAGLLLKSQDPNGLEEAQGPHGIDVRRVLGGLEGDLDVALRGEVVDLVGLDLLDDPDQIGGVGQVSVMQVKPAVGVMGILVEVVDAIGIEQGSPALDPVDLIALLQQQLGQIRTILSRNPRDQSDFTHVETTSLSRANA